MKQSSIFFSRFLWLITYIYALVKEKQILNKIEKQKT